MGTFYGEDLTHVHHAGFGAFAAGAAPGLLAMLRGAGVHGGLVVDLGCGSGVWARALLDAGYSVLGVDRSPAMIGVARSVAPGARFVEGSLYVAALPPCAAVTAIGEGLGYLGPEDPREALPELLLRVHRALAPGGLLVFDVVLRSGGRPTRYQSAREGEGWRVETEVEENPEVSLLTRRVVTVRRLEGGDRRGVETHRVRTFSRGELERLLRGSGFSVRVHRGYGEMPLAPQRLAFRARKGLAEPARRC